MWLTPSRDMFAPWIPTHQATLEFPIHLHPSPSLKPSQSIFTPNRYGHGRAPPHVPEHGRPFCVPSASARCEDARRPEEGSAERMLSVPRPGSEDGSTTCLDQSTCRRSNGQSNCVCQTPGFLRIKPPLMNTRLQLSFKFVTILAGFSRCRRVDWLSFCFASSAVGTAWESLVCCSGPTSPLAGRPFGPGFAKAFLVKAHVSMVDLYDQLQ